MEAEIGRHQPSFGPIPPPNHDVCLSFARGDKNFVGRLHKALTAAAIHTFRVDEDVPKGRMMWPEFLEAIETSRVSVVVLSKDYAAKSGCLDELAKILECRKVLGQAVVPVFYDVDPSDLAEQRGGFGESFAGLEVRYQHDGEKVEMWRSALTEAANTSGWLLRNAEDDGFEARLIGDIVADVQNRLNHKANDPCVLEESLDPLGSHEGAGDGVESHGHPFLSVDHESDRRWNYDVFLSFRGEDSRKTMTGHLHAALVQAGIRTFKDDEELERGHKIRSNLMGAIRESRICIVVLSKNYASSSWCLEELAQIIECTKVTGQLVIPVFYHVRPSDVRKQSGSFGDAFVKHEKRLRDEKKVMRWRDALREAGNISGWNLQDLTNGDESKFIRKIVTEIESSLNHKMLHVAKYPVGFESSNSPVARLHQLLAIGSNDVRVVGIYGMGGSGKTTISKAFYNSASRFFQGSCFLANVREESRGATGLVGLQERLLSETLNRKNLKAGNSHRGICLIKERLCRKRVLIILDDVDQLEQLDSLAGHRRWFGVGSRIIITTRSKYILNQPQVDERYQAKELGPSDSLRLFSLHAFGEPEPLEDFAEVSNKIVRYTGGLPLALEVIGSSLFGKPDMEEWESRLEKLQKVPDNDVQGVLRISFDALGDDVLKNTFLDIACFFVGMDKEQAIDILDGCDMFARNGIGSLNDRCLLTLCREKKLRMHDLLRDMGREIVRAKSPHNPGKRSRLWCHEDAYDVLKRHKGSEEVLGLVLDPATKMHLSTKAFAGMKNLRLLQVNNVHLDGSFEGLFEELRWLCWRRCPLKCLPHDFHPEKLVYFDLQHSNVGTLWRGSKRFGKLKILDLSYSKIRTSPDLTQLTGLEKLTLRFCPDLSKIHHSIGLLPKLLHLDLGHCNKLGSLPSSICSLTTLEHLDLDFCSSLGRLPDQFGNMKSLANLCARGTSIRELPDSVGNMKKLTLLSLRQRSNLKPRFPFSLFEILPRTQTPGTVRFLPPSVSGLCLLRNLDLSECNLSDGDVPDDLSGLVSLKFLNLDLNHFRILPLSLAQLSNLESLWLDGCKSLHTILGWPPNLQNLYSSGCTSLETVPDLSSLKRLKHLEFVNCCSLAEIRGLGNLDSVLHVNLEGCRNLTTSFENTMFQVRSGRKANCSVYFPRRVLPCWFMHRGCTTVTFDVPPGVEHGSLRLALWVDYVNESDQKAVLEAGFVNGTAGTKWTHYGHASRTSEAKSWVNHGPQPYLIKSGDKIQVSIRGGVGVKVDKCGVHVAYIPRVES